MRIDVILSNTLMQEGLIILLVGLITVFSALISLFIVFQFLVPRILKLLFEKKKPTDTGQVDYVSGEQIAAASVAVHLYLNEVHDDENAILTIHESVKEYSPWSSKIYVTHHMGKK